MNARTLLLIASFCAAWPTAVRADDDDHFCSVRTLQGSFGFTFTGTANTPGGPSHRGGVGRYVFDGLGNIDGTVTVNADGNVVRRTLVGTYTVEPDCTGSFAITFTDAADGHATFDMVIDDDGREVRTVSTPPPGAVNPPTLTSVLRRQFSRRSIE